MHADDLTGLGPFFAADAHARADAPADPWSPLGDLLTASVMTERVENVRAALAPGSPGGRVDIRVAASVAHLGIVARIVAPMIAAAAISGVRLDDSPLSASLSDLWWQNRLGGPFPLSVTFRERGGPLLWADTAVAELTDAFAGSFSMSRQVLGGNIASAANSAARLVGEARSEFADSARAAADEILAQPDVEDGILRAGPGFRRRSCCLIYRVSGDRTAICGDCVLG